MHAGNYDAPAPAGTTVQVSDTTMLKKELMPVIKKERLSL